VVDRIFVLMGTPETKLARPPQRVPRRPGGGQGRAAVCGRVSLIEYVSKLTGTRPADGLH
jgi:hypothetical protein